jgi:hypothetical protein
MVMYEWVAVSGGMAACVGGNVTGGMVACVGGSVIRWDGGLWVTVSGEKNKSCVD